MKYYQKRRHLISKMIAGIILFFILFFALCDCTPKATTTQTTITFERNGS